MPGDNRFHCPAVSQIEAPPCFQRSWPFAETKEQLGGFYMIEARDLNDAIQVAAKIPSAKLGSVEVRPIVEFDKP